MGDPPNSVPPYDPSDSPINYNFFGFMNDSNPTLANLSATNDPNTSFDPFAVPFSYNINNPPPINNHPTANWDHQYYNRVNINTTTQQQAGSSRGPNYAESSSRQATFSDDQTRPLLVWPPEVVPYQCSCCQVLREIIHTDVTGRCATKLEIHGRLGIICHAVLEIKDRISLVPSPSQFHMIDFCKKSLDNVKEYLQEYCNNQKRAGLIVVQDPLSTFYQALCVGIEWPENNVNINEQPIVPEQSREVVVAQEEGAIVPRTNLSQQRERAGRLTLRDFQDYFHLTMKQAAQQMNLCSTVVKKICRRDGMPRWPHRKIKSRQRKITNLQAILSSSVDAGERARAEAEIQRLEEEIANICAGENNSDDTAGGNNNNDSTE